MEIPLLVELEKMNTPLGRSSITPRKATLTCPAQLVPKVSKPGEGIVKDFYKFTHFDFQIILQAHLAGSMILRGFLK